MFIRSTITILVILFVNATSLNAQIQKGLDVNGEAGFNWSGWSVSMPDSNTVAIGAIWNDGNGADAGHVRIYVWDGISWQQKGADIDGEAAGDSSGYSVSMPDPNTVAIGATANDGNGYESGHVRIYSWDGFTWIQKGADIDGEATFDNSGYSVCMPDSNTIAIGMFSGNGLLSGHVRIFVWNGNSWIQKGANIYGEAPSDIFGSSISMPDINTIGIGAPWNDGNGMNAGHARIYTWNGSMWIQKGTDVDGEVAGDMSGSSVCMPDSNTIAIGAPRNDGNGTDAGHVRIYFWDGGSWQQKGTDIDGEASGNSSGNSISMPDANTIAIGAWLNSGNNGPLSGHVRVYRWHTNAWIQEGIDIDGEAIQDYSGWSISMPDAYTVSIGAYGNNGIGFDSGHVRAYNLSNTVGISDNASNYEYQWFPNPTNGKLTIVRNEICSFTQVTVRNSMGQEIINKRFYSSKIIELEVEGAGGIYFLEIMTDTETAVLKIIKE